MDHAWGETVEINGRRYECLVYGRETPEYRQFVVIPEGSAIFSPDDEEYEFTFREGVVPIRIVVRGGFASDGKWQMAKVG